MTSTGFPDRKPNVSFRDYVPLLSGISGVVALFGWIGFVAVIPHRVAQLEVSDRDQTSEIRIMKEDAAQRREVLASAMATLTQINERTKRLEDHLIK